MPLSRSNIPPEALRWPVKRAAVEFRLNHMTLRKLLGAAGVQTDGDSCVSTSQIVEALYGSMHQAKLETEKERKKKLALENAILEATVVDRATLMAGLERIADAMVSRITASELSREAQDDLLRELSSIPVTLEEVAAAQTRLPRASRHAADEPEIDDDEPEIDEDETSVNDVADGGGSNESAEKTDEKFGVKVHQWAVEVKGDEWSAPLEKEQAGSKTPKRHFRMKPGFVKASSAP
jgi:hypothetical protein